MATEKQEIALGSGHFYTMEYTGTIPEDDVIETEENRLAFTKGGATIEYTTETYTEQDDYKLKTKTITTSEDVVVKGGLLAWNGKTIEKLSATARVTDNPTEGKRTVKIGGVGNDNGKKYLIRFVHKDASGQDTRRFTIAGKNQAGFSMAFAMDAGTTLEPEFKAEPLDDEGTLLIYEEAIPKAGG